MDTRCSKVITDEDVQNFRQRLSRYKMSTLRIFYEYFWNDLKHIVEVLDTQTLLGELKLRNVPMETDYLLMEKSLGATTTSEFLIKDIIDMGLDPVLSLWESLYVLQNTYQHPNLIGVLAELIHKGDTLESQISLDKEGHELRHLKDTQHCHKKHLLDKTKDFQERRAPRVTEPIRSCNISSCYLDLVVVSSHQFKNCSQHEIIETGGRHEHYLRKASSTLERISPDRLFRYCHRSDCIPHAVMIIGVPGVGKTTLMQKFVYDWVTMKHYQRFSFIFFFKFRELNKYNEVSLDTMILNQYPHLYSQLDNILQNPEKLLFIFDGLDESVRDIDFRSERVCLNTKEPTSLEKIVVSLVKQKLLKGSSVLITSRPTKLASVGISTFQRISEIMGFFPKEREAYFDNFFHDKEVAKRAFHYVRENDILYTFCFIPSYCWIVCTVLSVCFPSTHEGQQDPFRPKTVTQLFSSYVANILLNHNTDTESPVELIKSIGEMAEYGVMNRILTFDSKYLDTFGMGDKKKLLSSFVIETDRSDATNYTFLHLTIQEFFSALLHYLNYSEEKLHKSLQKARSFEDGRGEMFLRFLCGLSDGSTISLLKDHLSGDISASTHVIRWLSQEIQSTWREEIDPSEKMNILTYLFESRNKQLVHTMIRPHGRLDFSEFHLSPVDCTVLAFILESCEETEQLNLDRCFIQSEGLQKLSGVLHTVRELRLSNNDLKNSDMELIYSFLARPDSRVAILRLRDNSLTWESCPFLACALSESRDLRELDLSRNNLTGLDFDNLLTALSHPKCSIERLSLSQIKLRDEYASPLKLLCKTPNLTHLDLSHNFLTDASAQHMHDIILDSPKLKEIRLDVNEFSKEKESFLKDLQAIRQEVSVII